MRTVLDARKSDVGLPTTLCRSRKLHNGISSRPNRVSELGEVKTSMRKGFSTSRHTNRLPGPKAHLLNPSILWTATPQFSESRQALHIHDDKRSERDSENVLKSTAEDACRSSLSSREADLSEDQNPECGTASTSLCSVNLSFPSPPRA